MLEPLMLARRRSSYIAKARRSTLATFAAASSSLLPKVPVDHPRPSPFTTTQRTTLINLSTRDRPVTSPTGAV
jgi:hypothetical protein